MSADYEVLWLEELPEDVVELDFSNVDEEYANELVMDFAVKQSGFNPGQLAFRYKHGWILINPLIPSRGRLGGGLARKHGVKSGSITKGHFEGVGKNTKFVPESSKPGNLAQQNAVSKAKLSSLKTEAGMKAALPKAEAKLAEKQSLSSKYTEAKAAALGASEQAKKAHTYAAHSEAATSHAHAFVAAKQAGQEQVAAEHKFKAMKHAEMAGKLKKSEAAKNAAAKKAENAKVAQAKKQALKAEINQTLAAKKEEEHAKKVAAQAATDKAFEASGVAEGKGDFNSHIAAGKAHQAAAQHHYALGHQSQSAIHEDEYNHHLKVAGDLQSAYAAQAKKSFDASMQAKSASPENAAEAHAKAAHEHLAAWHAAEKSGATAGVVDTHLKQAKIHENKSVEAKKSAAEAKKVEPAVKPPMSGLTGYDKYASEGSDNAQAGKYTDAAISWITAGSLAEKSGQDEKAYKAALGAAASAESSLKHDKSTQEHPYIMHKVHTESLEKVAQWENTPEAWSNYAKALDDAGANPKITDAQSEKFVDKLEKVVDDHNLSGSTLKPKSGITPAKVPAKPFSEQVGDLHPLLSAALKSNSQEDWSKYAKGLNEIANDSSHSQSDLVAAKKAVESAIKQGDLNPDTLEPNAKIAIKEMKIVPEAKIQALEESPFGGGKEADDKKMWEAAVAWKKTLDAEPDAGSEWAPGEEEAYNKYQSMKKQYKILHGTDFNLGAAKQKFGPLSGASVNDEAAKEAQKAKSVATSSKFEPADAELVDTIKGENKVKDTLAMHKAFSEGPLSPATVDLMEQKYLEHHGQEYNHQKASAAIANGKLVDPDIKSAEEQKKVEELKAQSEKALKQSEEAKKAGTKEAHTEAARAQIDAAQKAFAANQPETAQLHQKALATHTEALKDMKPLGMTGDKKHDDAMMSVVSKGADKKLFAKASEAYKKEYGKDFVPSETSPKPTEDFETSHLAQQSTQYTKNYGGNTKVRHQNAATDHENAAKYYESKGAPGIASYHADLAEQHKQAAAAFDSFKDHSVDVPQFEPIENHSIKMTSPDGEVTTVPVKNAKKLPGTDIVVHSGEGSDSDKFVISGEKAGIKLPVAYDTAAEARKAATWVRDQGLTELTPEGVKKFRADIGDKAYEEFKKNLHDSIWNNPPKKPEVNINDLGIETFKENNKAKAAERIANRENMLQHVSDKDADATKSLNAQISKLKEAFKLKFGEDYDKSKAGTYKLPVFSGISKTEDGLKLAAAEKALKAYENGESSEKISAADVAALKEKFAKKWGTEYDPNKVGKVSALSPASVSVFKDNAAVAQKKFPSSHMLGYVLPLPEENINQGFKATPLQEDAIHSYTGSMYTPINDYLRGKEVDSYSLDSAKDYIEQIDQLFHDIPPLVQPIVLSRKVANKGAFPTYPPPIEPGQTFIDKGYGSTSKDPNIWNGRLHMEIRVPAGKKVLDANHVTGSSHSHESEVLLPRNVEYRVISDTMTNEKDPGSGDPIRKLIVEVV